MQHYEEVGLSRQEHFVYAWSVIGKLFVMCIVLIIHSFAPRFFKKTFSTKLKELYNENSTNKLSKSKKDLFL